MQPVLIENQIEMDSLPQLRQLSGANKGATFSLKALRTTIGRSESNHVVLQDESVSRVHAIIEKNEDGSLVILDNRSRNGLLINGVKTEASVLQPGDEIHVGAILLKVYLPQRSSVAAADFHQENPAPVSTKSPRGINKRVLIYGGAGILILLVVLTNTNDNTQKKNSAGQAPNNTNLKVEVSAPPKIPLERELSEGRKVDLTKSPVELELEKLAELDVGVEDSEIHFRKGQRDFFNKNYHRAISSLELALSLNRSHPSAGYYLQAAIYQAEEEASKNHEMGRKYFASLQYRRAIYHFKQVKALLAHKKEDPVLRECDEYIQLAEQRLKAAELYP